MADNARNTVTVGVGSLQFAVPTGTDILTPSTAAPSSTMQTTSSSVSTTSASSDGSKLAPETQALFTT